MTSRAAQHFARRRLAGDKAITVWLTPAVQSACEAAKAKDGLSYQKRFEAMVGAFSMSPEAESAYWVWRSLVEER